MACCRRSAVVRPKLLLGPLDGDLAAVGHDPPRSGVRKRHADADDRVTSLRVMHDLLS